MQRVRLPYEHFSKLFLEHENFNEAQQNEETLVPFLNYPVQRLFSYEEKKALYDKYASVSCLALVLSLANEKSTICILMLAFLFVFVCM